MLQQRKQTFFTGHQFQALLLAATSILANLGCKPFKLPTSTLSNIYSADTSNSDSRGNQRRRMASKIEANWTVEVQRGSCSGILLSARYLLTAAHCKCEAGDIYRSGLAAAANDADDIQVTRVVERDIAIDYMIVEINWIRPMSAAQKFPPSIARSQGDLTISPNADEGEHLFTVGFPDDKKGLWALTYSEGQAKQIVDEGRLALNLGIINGNSGGGILKKNSYMLTSIVRSGSRRYLEEGWDNNDLNDPYSWNQAAPLWVIYPNSPVLKELFPAGQASAENAVLGAFSQLFASIEENSSGSYLWISAVQGAHEVLTCPAQSGTCTAMSPGVKSLVKKEQKADRQLFRDLTPSLQKKENSLLIVAYDSQGKLLSKRQVRIKKKE